MFVDADSSHTGAQSAAPGDEGFSSPADVRRAEAQLLHALSTAENVHGCKSVAAADAATALGVLYSQVHLFSTNFSYSIS